MPTNNTRNEWYNKAIAKWALVLLDELENMMHGFKKHVKKGEVQDALHELYRVLIMASLDELADEALSLKQKLDRAAASASIPVTSTRYYYQTVSIEKLREELKELVRRVRMALS